MKRVVKLIRFAVLGVFVGSMIVTGWGLQALEWIERRTSCRK